VKKKIRILITGSRGFVGKNLKIFFKNKSELIVFSDKKSNYDLSKKKNFKKLFEITKPQVIIHLASRTISESNSYKENKLQLKNTYKPIKNLIECIKYQKNLEKIIFLGTIEEYGNAKMPYSENSKAKPISSYGKSKLNCINFIKKKLKNKKVRFIWLRPSLMFGPFDNRRRFLGSIFNSLKNKKTTSIYLDNQVRDYLYVNDLIRFIYYNLIKKKLPDINILNVTNENWVYLRLVLNTLAKMTDGKIRKYLKLKKTSNNSKLINSGKLIQKNYPNFKFTNFTYALKKTLRSYNIVNFHGSTKILQK